MYLLPYTDGGHCHILGIKFRFRTTTAKSLKTHKTSVIYHARHENQTRDPLHSSHTCGHSTDDSGIYLIWHSILKPKKGYFQTLVTMKAWALGNVYSVILTILN